jgi:predicted RNA-binding protein YlxR (DUF448 family)
VGKVGARSLRPGGDDSTTEGTMSESGQHAPQRTCVICGRKTDKRSLLRIVAPKNRPAYFDPTREAPGRGAYVCNECATGGEPVSIQRLSYALRKKITAEEWGLITPGITA